MNLVIGKDKKGKEVLHDLTKLPVILMAGETGSGKSNLTHHFICSLIKQFSQADLKLVLIDCKRVEFDSYYKNSPYLFSTIKYCNKKDSAIFDELTKEICRRMDSKNTKPFIFIAIDEFSDLVCYNPEQLENLVEAVSVSGPKTGIGMVLHTSRSGRDVITKKIDKVVQSRIGLKTASDSDSKMIIHQKGCTKLKGGGDGLYLRCSESPPIHFQAPLITDEDIKKTVNKI